MATKHDMQCVLYVGTFQEPFQAPATMQPTTIATIRNITAGVVLLSLLLLLVTVFTYLSFRLAKHSTFLDSDGSTKFHNYTTITSMDTRKLRRLDDLQLFLNIWFSLIALYIVYIGSTYAVMHSTTCVLLSTLFHYTFLVAMVAITVDVTSLFMCLFTKPPKAYPSMAICVTWSKLVCCDVCV